MRGYNPFTDPVEPSMKGELWKKLRVVGVLITLLEALMTAGFFTILPASSRTTDLGAGLIFGLLICLFVMWRTA